jgi:predicted 3-demethylubiquinone-9 3-methyltransferase (glyoxalase superfamily)
MFRGNAEEAMDFYTSLIKDSKITSITRYQEANGPGKKGSVMKGSVFINRTGVYMH